MAREYDEASSGFGLHILDSTLIVPVKGELNDDSVELLRREILDEAQAPFVTGVLIDMSAVRVLDSVAFSMLADTARMISLLGRRSVFVGFQAGVASALIDLDADLTSITTALTMNDGLELLRSLAPSWKRVITPEGETLDDEAENDGIHEEGADIEPAGEREDDHERER